MSSIVVIGMGYVGIRHSLFAIQRRSGWKIACLNNGECPFDGDEPGLSGPDGEVCVQCLDPLSHTGGGTMTFRIRVRRHGGRGARGRGDAESQVLEV